MCYAALCSRHDIEHYPLVLASTVVSDKPGCFTGTISPSALPLMVAASPGTSYIASVSADGTHYDVCWATPTSTDDKVVVWSDTLPQPAAT